MQSILQGKPGPSYKASVVRQQFKTKYLVCLCNNKADFISYIDSLQYHSFVLADFTISVYGAQLS